MKSVRLFFLMLLLLAACSIPSGELTVENVRANLTLPSSTGSVWLVIENGTDSDDALIGAEIPGCGVVELHDMIMDGDVMKMQPVEGGKVIVPAGETVELKMGGLHIMCIDKEAPLEPGTSIAIALQFENAGTINVTGEVVEPGEMEMKKDN
ncbi:MAG: copper chaperone PCu(A)C [Anaerolineales bacterium]|nr:copper chaperone PCu(A)C [Anaerolineales bacterium]